MLPTGEFDLKFMDIAATVNPATVHFRSLTEPSRVSVLEQNYEYDLLEPDKLLRKYVGREVTLVRTVQEDGTTRQEEVKAELLSYNNAPVWRIGKEIVTGLHADHIRFPELPDNLYQPSDAHLDAAERRRAGDIASRRRTSPASWRGTPTTCSTVAPRRQERGPRRLGHAPERQRHVVQERQAAARRRRSESRAAGGRRRDGSTMARKSLEMAAAAPMAQESFSEYHLYTLGRKTTINNAETKQVSMLGGTGVPVQKRFVVDGQDFYYHNQQHPGAPIKDVVQVYYQFKNDEKAGLGMPMPAGTVRVYQADSKGGVQFAGEDRIGHTPKDETLKLKIGNAFDVVCERNQIDFQKIASNVYEFEYEITLRNHKAIPITVEVNEPIGGTWRMVRSSHTLDEDGGLGRAVQRARWRRTVRRRSSTASGSLTDAARDSRLAARCWLCTAIGRAAANSEPPAASREPQTKHLLTGRRS